MKQLLDLIIFNYTTNLLNSLSYAYKLLEIRYLQNNKNQTKQLLSLIEAKKKEVN